MVTKDNHFQLNMSAAYKHIVRFEIPQNALDYLVKIGVQDSEKLYHNIMVKEKHVPRKTF